MDENMEVDELFGDSAALDTAMDTAMDMTLPTPLKGLAQRLHEVHTSGCTQMIACSKTGCIAYVSPDGMSIKLAFLTNNAKDGSWSLKDNFPNNRVNVLDGKHPIVHLQWNPSSMMDLAVVDAAGRVSIINHSYMALNTISLVRAAVEDQENDLNRPVGMYWLNRERPLLAFLNASKENKWAFIPTKRLPFGPHHHFALAVVTKSGNFRLLYQQANGNWKHTSAGLQKMSSTNELVTHAAIGSMKDGSLLVAMQTYGCDLHTFRVKIDWVQEKNQPENIRQASISVEHIRGNLSCGIFKEPNAALLGDASLPSYSKLSLSHLEIIQPSDVERSIPTAPMILAVYSTSLNSMGLPNFAHGAPSIAVRWQLKVSEQKLHPSFDEINSKATDPKPKRKIDLMRLDDVPLNQVVTALQQVDQGMIAFVFGDGSIHVHDAMTLNNLHNEQELGKAMNLSKAGFAFQSLQPEAGGLHFAMSPNACLAVVLDTEGKVQCRDLRLWQASQDEEDQNLGIETAVNALALTFGRACLASCVNDDIVKIMMTQFPDQQVAFLETLYRSLFTDADFTSGLDALAKKTFIPKVLSIQAAFGFRTHGPGRNVSSAFAWATLNIRQISLYLLLILTFIKQSGGLEFRDPDLLSTVLHNVTYAQSLFAYLINNLFEMAAPTNTTSGNPSPEQQRHADLTALLFLSCFSRFFLRHLCRALRGVALLPYQPSSPIKPAAEPAFKRISMAIDPTIPSMSQRRQSTASSTATSDEPSSPIKMEAVERLLGNIDKFVTAAYESAGLTTDAQKATVERELLSHGKVPDVLSGVIERVQNEILPITRTEVSRLDVWMSSYEWLDIWGESQDTSTATAGVPKKRSKLIDVHKKRPIKIHRTSTANPDSSPPSSSPTLADGDVKKRRMRHCIRCGASSEDIIPPRGMPPYLRQGIGRCICEGCCYVS